MSQCKAMLPLIIIFVLELSEQKVNLKEFSKKSSVESDAKGMFDTAIQRQV